jgi:hypothetical protein
MARTIGAIRHEVTLAAGYWAMCRRSLEVHLMCADARRRHIRIARQIDRRRRLRLWAPVLCCGAVASRAGVLLSCTGIIPKV